MKRIIIAICGIMVAGGAMGAPKRILNTPVLVQDANIFKAWNMDFLLPDSGMSQSDLENIAKKFNAGNVKGTFAPNWQFNTKAGTYGSNNEGSITPIIAREIYEHGGKFCMTQMQASYGSNSGKFIDYFDDNTGKNRYKCQVICEPGYYGDYCLKRGYDCPKEDETVDYTKDLNNRKDDSLRLLSGNNDGQIKPEVFYYNNGNSSNDSKAYVLGLLFQKEHAVIVSPVYVKAEKNVITKAQANSDFNKLLCAPGYKANSLGNDCVLNDSCTAGYTTLCPGLSEDDFDSSLHEITVGHNEVTGTDCRYFVCKQGNDYIFNPDTKTCDKCETTFNRGIVGGKCKTCPSGEMYKDGNCHRYTTYSAQDLMRGIERAYDCWKEGKQADYKKCVECKKPYTYKAETKECK